MGERRGDENTARSRGQAARAGNSDKAARAAAKHSAEKANKGNWKKRIGGMVALIVLFGAGMFQFVSTVLWAVRGSGIVSIDVSNTAQVKDILFGGEPWLIYCVNNETSSHRLPQILEDSARGLYSSIGLNTGVMGCWDKTESGRSVAERFNLNRKPPLSFVVANGNKPRQLNLVGVSQMEDLEKRAKPALELRTYKIDTLKKWPSLCTSRKACIVIGHKQLAFRDHALNLFRPLQKSHRAVKIVTLDTSFWQVKLDDEFLKRRSGRKVGEVLCLSRVDGGSGNLTHRGSFIQDLDAGSASAFVKACEAREGLMDMELTPKIKARPSKPKPASAPRPAPKERQASSPSSKSRDHVGSRDQLENDEDPLFETVDGDDQTDLDDDLDDEDDEEQSDNADDEVEL